MPTAGPSRGRARGVAFVLRPAERRGPQRRRRHSTVLYGIPNIRVEYHPPEAGIPVGYWRSVGYSQNTFFMESFIDEMAAAGGKDPVELRRRLLAKLRVRSAVLESGRRKSRLGQAAAAGRFRGVAVVNNLGGFNAQVAEVSVDQGQDQGPSRRLRGRLRPGGQSRGRRAADSGRHRVRLIARSRAASRSITAACSRGTSTTTTCCASTKCR